MKENKTVTSFAIDPQLKAELKRMGYKSMSQFLCELIAKVLDEAEYGGTRHEESLDQTKRIS